MPNPSNRQVRKPHDETYLSELPAYATTTKKKSVVALEYLSALLKECAAGTKLPSEREIADTLGMTRSPVHEALIALRMVGHVRIEPGVGAFVLAPAAQEPTRSELVLLADSESPHEVFELRVIIETAILQAVIRDLRAESISALEIAFRDLSESMARGGIAAYIEANRAFHLALASVCQNTLLERIEHWILYDMMTQSLWTEVLKSRLEDLGSDIAEVIENLIVEHRQILDSIRERDLEAAVDSMMRHIAHIEAVDDN